MVSKKHLSVLSLCFALSLTLSAAFWSDLLPGVRNLEAEARHHARAAAHQGGSHKKSSQQKGSTKRTSRHGAAPEQKASHHGSRRHGHARHEAQEQPEGKTRSGRHHGRRGRRHAAQTARVKHVAAEKHAYALDFFMMKAPDFERSSLDAGLAAKIREAFAQGIADDIPAEKLVRAGVFNYFPLSGGIFKRRDAIKYIVLHSTETGIPVPGVNVIKGWNSMGRRHPGAQFVVDRDGTIYMALDPELASVHVNVFKTLPGINNDNTVGIEMNHTGKQDYPAAERRATIRLITYLQHRYNVTAANVISHRYAQQGDHTDPINFDLDTFLATKDDFAGKALALKRTASPLPVDEETEDDAPLASVYIQIHGPLADPVISTNKTPAESLAGSAGSAAPGRTPSTPPLAMPGGTYVAGGPLSPGASPASEGATLKPPQH
jgi:hypothetical protein